MIRATSDGVPYRVTFTDGRFAATSDTTAEKGGGDAGFGPHELLEAALATCLTITLEKTARQQGIPLERAGAAGLKRATRARLAAHNAANPGASTSVRRVLLLQEPPNAAAHELSDKGTVNRSAVLTRRAADVERLYAEPPATDVIKLD